MSAAALHTPRSCRLGVRNIYIWPSREGVIFLIGWLVILLGAVNFNNALIYALAFLLAGVFLVCMLQTYVNVYGIDLNIFPARSVHQGAAAIFPVLLRSPAGSRGLTLSAYSSDTAEEPAGMVTMRLVAGLDNRLEMAVQADRRGWLELHRVRLESRYPAGLFRAWTLVHTAARCLVYPRPASASSRLPPQRPAPDEQSSGDQLQAQAGASDFQGLRAYQPGDPPRSIAWKSLRGETLLINRFSDHGHTHLVLDWNALADLAGTEARLSQLCSWVLQADQARIAYELRLPGRQVPAAAGGRHKQVCLEALALHERQD